MFSKLHTKISNINTLEIALREMGLAFLKKGRARDSDGKKIYADLVVILKGNSDVGFVYNPDRGTYDILLDVWGISCTQKPSILIKSIVDNYDRFS